MGSRVMDRKRYAQVVEGADLVWSEADVDAAYGKLAREISEALAASTPLVIPVMMGGMVPASRTVSQLTFPVELDYVHATRYRGDVRGRTLEWIAHPSSDFKGRSVLVVDDILDEGITLAAIIAHCRELGAREVYCAVLVDKRIGRPRVLARADFTGLEVDDRYVFGCGMDYRGYFRNLPAVYALGDA